MGIISCIDKVFFLMAVMYVFVSQVNFPLCTIAHTPRLPEHCVEYAKVLVWPQELPFGGIVLCRLHVMVHCIVSLN